MRINVYVEGHPSLRKGFRIFFENYFSRKLNISVFACKGKPVREFCIACKQKPDDFHILLMDADVLEPPFRGSVRKRKEWETLGKREIPDDRLHFMVQCMESWFMADKECLAAYYGQGFTKNNLPKRKNIEDTPKEDVLNGLKRAVEKTQKAFGQYKKGKHAAEIIEKIDPRKVRRRAPHCKKLLDVLETYI